jgi:TRAP-type C4-dicarboxylate transport system permease small subunit
VLRAIDTIIHKILLIIAQLGLAAMITIVCMTVYYRFILNTGIIWAEEVPRTLVALFAFIACAMGVRDQLHIGIGVIYERFPKGGKVRKVLDTLAYLSTMAVGYIMLVHGWRLCVQLGRFKMSATGLPRSVQYISLPFAGAIIMYDSLLYLLGVLNDEHLLYSEKEPELEVIHVEKAHSAKGGAE